MGPRKRRPNKRKIDGNAEKEFFQEFEDGIKSALNPQSELNTQSFSRFVSQFCESGNGVKWIYLICEDAVNRIFKDHLNEIKSVCNRANERELIPTYLRCWTDYEKTMSRLQSIANYIWRRTEKIDINKNILSLWNKIITPEVKIKLINQILTEIDADGPEITCSVISVIHSFETLGIFDLHVGERLISDAKIKSLALFNSFCLKDEYLTEASKIINKYRNKLGQCLSEDRTNFIVLSFENVFFHGYFKDIVKQYKTALEEENYHDNNLMLKLAKKIPGGLVECLDLFVQHIVKKGVSVIEDNLDAISNTSNLYMKILVNFHETNMDTISKNFHDEVDVKESFNKAYDIILKRKHTTVLKQVFIQPNSLKVLITYWNSKIKNHMKNNNDNELTDLRQHMKMIFDHTCDKELFEEGYRHHLITTLSIHSPQKQIKIEEALITHLSDFCGVEYVRTLHHVLNDTTVSSTNVNAQFRKHHDVVLDEDANKFTTTLLRPWLWNVKMDLNLMRLPPSITQYHAQISSWYRTANTDRHLKWALELCRAELTFDNKYTLIVSSSQLVVLMTFNSRTEHSFLELLRRTQIDKEYLIHTLKSLFQCELLLTRDDVSLSSNTKIRLNENFTNESREIDLMSNFSGLEANVENNEPKEVCPKIRRIQLDAAIVRIMKREKELLRTELTNRIIILTNFQFTPTEEEVNKRIESLIDRDYLEYDGNNSKIKYLS